MYRCTCVISILVTTCCKYVLVHVVMSSVFEYLCVMDATHVIHRTRQWLLHDALLTSSTSWPHGHNHTQMLSLLFERLGRLGLSCPHPQMVCGVGCDVESRHGVSNEHCPLRTQLVIKGMFWTSVSGC